VERVVKVHVSRVDLEPALGALGAAENLSLLGDVAAHGSLLMYACAAAHSRVYENLARFTSGLTCSRLAAYLRMCRWTSCSRAWPMPTVASCWTGCTRTAARPCRSSAMAWAWRDNR